MAPLGTRASSTTTREPHSPVDTTVDTSDRSQQSVSAGAQQAPPPPALTATQQALQELPPAPADLPPEAQRRYRQVRQLAHVLDSAFTVPGTQRTFGVDALIGLIPGVGGAAGLLLSAGLVVQAVRIGARVPTVLRMLLIAGVDALLGSVPVVGQISDFVLKANERNVRVLASSALDPEAAASDSTRVLLVAAAVVVAILVAMVGLITLLLAWLLSAIL